MFFCISTLVTFLQRLLTSFEIYLAFRGTSPFHRLASMPGRVSERTPLLSGGGAARGSLTFIETAQACFSLILDATAFIPCSPILLALYWLELQDEEFIGYWIVYTVVFSVLTALLAILGLYIFGPFIFFSVAVLLSFCLPT
jgi:hypothetical protein